jgi:hypothetical protein
MFLFFILGTSTVVYVFSRIQHTGDAGSHDVIQIPVRLMDIGQNHAPRLVIHCTPERREHQLAKRVTGDPTFEDCATFITSV